MIKSQNPNKNRYLQQISTNLIINVGIHFTQKNYEKNWSFLVKFVIIVQQPHFFFKVIKNEVITNILSMFQIITIYLSRYLVPTTPQFVVNISYLLINYK